MVSDGLTCRACGKALTGKQVKVCSERCREKVRVRSRAGPPRPEYEERDAGYTTPCWVWLRNMDRKGYGKLSGCTGFWSAHRLYYAKLVGPIPEGMELDHLCRNRACVNPAHLEVVTPRQNWERGFSPSACAYRARIAKEQT